MEPAQWQQLKEQAPYELSRADQSTDSVLFPRERDGLCDFATNFYHGHLNNEGHNSNSHEVWVLEDAFEDVALASFEQSGVDLVEQLHEDKDLEKVSHVQQLRGWLSRSLVLRQVNTICSSFVFVDFLLNVVWRVSHS